MTSLIRNLLSKQKHVLKSTSNGFLNIIRGNGDTLGRPTHKVNNLEKRFLVWTKKYKTVEEVPDYVNQHVVERARNRMRIRIANYMIAASVVGCIAMVISGKNAAKRGESVQKQNLEWHRKLKEEIEQGKQEAK